MAHTDLRALGKLLAQGAHCDWNTALHDMAQVRNEKPMVFAAESPDTPVADRQQVEDATRALQKLRSQLGHPAHGALQALLRQR
eukprot:5620414-Pyramimonas_sp.AAC.1